MIRNRKPDVKFFDRRLMYNPFNIQFLRRPVSDAERIEVAKLSWLCYGAFVGILILIFGVYYYLKKPAA